MLQSLAACFLLQGACSAATSQLRYSKKKQTANAHQKELAIAREHIKRLQDENRQLKSSKFDVVMVRGLIQSRKTYREKEDGSDLVDMSIPCPFTCLALFPYLCGKASAKFLGYQFVPKDLYTDEFLLDICQTK